MNYTLCLAAALVVASLPAKAMAEEVEVAGPKGNLAATYLASSGEGPVVLILPGSGPTDRNGNNPAGVTASSYRLLAEGLAARGIGSLRADKRGMFGSAGAVADANAVTIGDYVDDVAAWSKLVRERTGRECVWLIGHSEGGIIALAAANRLEGLCGLVLVASPGRPVGTLLREQLRANPANAPILDQAETALAALEAGRRVDAATLHPGLAPLFAPQVQGFLADLMAHDPAALARKTTLPLLIVQGGKDLQVVEADAAALAAARPDAGLADFPGMNHVLKQVDGSDRAANLALYADPGAPLAPGLVDRIATFVTARR